MVLTTVANRRQADALARHLVRSRSAACVTILPGAVSHYVWKGKSHRSAECLLLVKTLASGLKRLKQEIQKTHPYELPEVLTLNVSSANAAYLKWMGSCL